MLSARERTDALTRAAVGYLVKKTYSVHVECGVLRWGRRRADILGLNMRRDLVAVEVKQSWADFMSDVRSRKYLDYIAVSHQFYFCLPYDFGPDRLAEARSLLPPEAGILLLEPHGLCRVIKSARSHEVEQDTIRWIVTKLAWRGGSGKHNSRRNRVYLK